RRCQAEDPGADDREVDLAVGAAQRRRRRGIAYQTAAKMRTVTPVAITVVVVPNRKSVISIVTPTIARARQLSPARASRFAARTIRSLSWRRSSIRWCIEGAMR